MEIKPRLEKVYDSVIEKAENAGEEEVNAALDEAKNRLDSYLKKIDGTDGTDPMKALTAETNEIVKDLKEYFAKDENVQAIITTLETATDASKIASFYADREGVINSSSGEASKFSIAGAALINVMDNKSVVEIVEGKTLNATSGNLNVDSSLKNVGLSVGGHIIPKSLDTAATDVIISVNNVSDTNAIKFGGNNSLRGDNITISANNEINHIYLNDGSGKGVNPSYHVTGTISYAGGSSGASIDMGAAPIINAKESFKVSANNNANIFNMTGGLSYGGGSASVGIGAAINNFDVATLANVGKNDNSGSLNAKNVEVKTTTNGMINSLSVAGGLSTASKKTSDEESQPKVTFDGAGSVSLNLGSRNTQSSLTNLDASNLNSVNVGAVDKNFTGAWSGAGALNFRGADSGKTSVAITGAVGVNNVDSTVEANISANKNLTGAINNTAEKSGALIAAGLGLTVSKASEKTDGNYTGAASASVNLSDNAVKAVLKDNTVANSSAINNIATNTDTQITGGVNVSVAVGGAGYGL